MTSLDNQPGQGPGPDEHPLASLVALVQGRLGLEEMRRTVRHARTCGTCQAELVEIAAGSGAMRLAGRADLASASPLPPFGLVDQISPSEEPGPVVTSDPAGPPLLRRHQRLLVLAAAVIAVVGVSVGLAATSSSSSSGKQPVVALAPLDHSGANGYIEMRSSGADQIMAVDTTLPPTAQGAYYEVWLLREQTGAMVPLGVLPVTGQARYVLPAELVAEYDAVDISLQPNDGSTQHSHDSVLRARFA